VKKWRMRKVRGRGGRPTEEFKTSFGCARARRGDHAAAQGYQKPEAVLARVAAMELRVVRGWLAKEETFAYEIASVGVVGVRGKRHAYGRRMAWAMIVRLALCGWSLRTENGRRIAGRAFASRCGAVFNGS